MELLIKITSDPLQMERFSQSGRLVNSDSVDIERRKALARHMSMRNSAPGVQGAASVTDLTRINLTFSKNSVHPQVPSESLQNVASRYPQYSVPVQSMPAVSQAQIENYSNAASVAVPASPEVHADISMENSSNYMTQRGSFEMRVARGDLTYLPPLVMTVITQRPQVHIEYLGSFNYVPPRDNPSGGNINLFT